jgi:2-iminobutanoate/2-iminopropanoate deaminase
MDMTFIRPSSFVPLSHAVVHGGLIYVSGQVGFRHGTSELVSADPADQCRQVFATLDAILAEAGTTRDRILKCGIILKHV